MWLNKHITKRLSRKVKKDLKKAFGPKGYDLWVSGNTNYILMIEIEVFEEKLNLFNLLFDECVFRPRGSGDLYNGIVCHYKLTAVDMILRNDDAFRNVIPQFV